MEVQCPTCSAKFKVPDTVSVVTCPYCGTTFELETKREAGDHFFFPTMKKDPGGVLLKFLSRQYGAPADITGAKVTRKELHWVPVYFFYARGKHKRWDTIEEILFEGIPAGSPLRSLLEGYPFPVRGKRFFEESVVKKGRYYEPEMSKEEAEKRVYEHLLNAIRRESSEEDKAFSDDDLEYEIKYQGLVHYPVWEIEYEYGGRRYTCYVDGTDGRVIDAKYPLMSEARRKATALGIGIIGGGVVIGLIASGIYGSIWGLVGSMIPSLVGAAAVFSKGSVKERSVREVEYIYYGSRHFD